MNYFKNGSFVSNRIEPWQIRFVDPGQITVENNAVRMPVSSQIIQPLDMDEVGQTTDFVFRVKARTAWEEPAPTKANPTLVIVQVSYQYGDTFTSVRKTFDVTDQLRTVEEQIVLAPPEPLRLVNVNVWVPAYPGPGYDLRDVWFTGFELEPLAQIP